MLIEKLTAILGSEAKAFAWMDTPNPHFGNVTPQFMMQTGRQQKIHRFVDHQLIEKIHNQCKACKELFIIGTDGCSTCDEGRVTMYTQGRQCTQCKQEKKCIEIEKF